MRLINVKTFKLEEFLDYRAPPYAILSHTWGDDCEELSYRDVEDGNIDKPGIGSVKFRGCCRQAAEDKLGYAWIDTCCIDKTNLVELSEAINSMFRWYQRASICYAFLSDVPSNESPREEGSKFQRSRWFDRGWTLQELLAPKTLRLYGALVSTNDTAAADLKVTKEWYLLGTKGSMSATIASITGIPREYLLGIARLHTASVAQRMSWAAHRDTKRKEDLAYCLLGIFDITMPMIYGEGGDQAFFRLQEQIMKVTRDDSILAWGLGNDKPLDNDTGKATAGRILAKAPADFGSSGQIIRREQSLKFTSSVYMSGGSIQAYLPLLTTSTGKIVGLLSCGPENNTQQVVGIPLIELSVGSSDEYARPRGYNSALYSTTASAAMPQPIRIKHDSQESAPADSSGLYFHYEDNDFTDINLKMIGVEPHSCWDEERALITSMVRANDGPLGQILIRLRHNEEGSKDFVIVLDCREQNSDTQAGCCVFICSRNTLLEELAANLPSMMQKLDGKLRARNGLLSLRVRLERLERQPIFVLRPESVLDEVFTTVDATVELEGKMLLLESLRLLNENEAIEREERKLEEELSRCNESLKEVKKEQEIISAKLKELEERRKELIETEKTDIEKRSELSKKLAETEEKLNGTSAQWVYTQRQWNELRQVDDPIISLKGKPAFEWAVEKGSIEVVKRCLNEGADVNARYDNGWTPLLVVSQFGYTEVARLLIEYGANIEAKNKYGVTPLHLASTYGYLELVQLLLDKGADIEARDMRDVTSLMAASFIGRVDTVRLLLDKGADIEAKDGNGVTALVAACHSGNTDLIQLLVDRGAEVDIKDKKGLSLLMRASAEGRMELVRQFLAIGKSSLYARDNEFGRTALEWATEKGHEAVAQLLRDADNSREKMTESVLKRITQERARRDT